MLEIGYLIICEDVIHDKNNVIIRKPLPIINPINIPGNFSFKVAFSMFQNNDDKSLGEDNTLNLTLTDHKGNEVVNTGELIIEPNPNGKSENKQIDIAEADINLNNIELRNEGIHTLTLKLNNQSKSIKIPVIQKEKRDN